MLSKESELPLSASGQNRLKEALAREGSRNIHIQNEPKEVKQSDQAPFNAFLSNDFWVIRIARRIPKIEKKCLLYFKRLESHVKRRFLTEGEKRNTLGQNGTKNLFILL
jgi:hypothetical protein